MDGREIPGFYFDREKNKYFKIQSAHTAPSRVYKYSRENVKNEQKKEKIKKDTAVHTAKIQKETVVRRQTWDFLSNACLDREIGWRRTSYYMHNVWPNACISGLPHKPRIVVNQPGRSPIRLFDRDPAKKTLYAVQGDNDIVRRRINPTDGLPLPPIELGLDDCERKVPVNEYSFEPWDGLARLTSSISSLVYLPTSGALAATTYGSDRPPVVYFSDPDNDGPFVNQQFTPKSTSTIWGSAACPASFAPDSSSNHSVPAADTENLAVAASGSLLLFTLSPTGLWDSSTVLKTDIDVLACEWLSPTVIAFGCRDGKIKLYDTRSKGSSNILKHPTPVSRLRRADDATRLVCSGLQNTLCLYDIRSPRLTSVSAKPNDRSYHHKNPETSYHGQIHHAKKKRKKVNTSTFEQYSQPVLNFQHRGNNELNLDIDIHPRLGLLAAAEDDQMTNAAIRIHNLWTGKQIKVLPRSGDETNSRGVSIRCLKFMDDEENGGMSLWANWLGGVMRFDI